MKKGHVFREVLPDDEEVAIQIPVADVLKAVTRGFKAQQARGRKDKKKEQAAAYAQFMASVRKYLKHPREDDAQENDAQEQGPSEPKCLRNVTLL